MPFQPGNPGRTPGSLNRKTKQWEALGAAIMGKHTDRFNKILDKLNDEDFMDRYTQVLEYFQGKIQRTILTGEDGKAIEVEFK